MTLTEELRAAAKVLRETASTATPGPWYTVGLPWNHDTPFVVAGHPDPHVGKFVADVEQVFGDDEDDRDHGSDAAWIALASPALAEPLADWLKVAGDDLGGAEAYLARTAPGEIFDPFDYVDEPDSVRHALTVARTILGRQP